MIYEYFFLISLALTIFVETIVLLLAVRYLFKLNAKKWGWGLLIFAGIIASFATLPYLWFIFPLFMQGKLAYILLGEGFAVLAEMIVYYFVLRIDMKRAFVLSLVCNLVSFLIGLIVF